MITRSVQASGGNTHQTLDVSAMAVGLRLDEVGQLDGVFGTGRQCTAHGVQVAAKDDVIRGKELRLQHWLGRANQIGMLLVLLMRRSSRHTPTGAQLICWKVRMPHQLAQATACRAPSSAAVPASS